MKKYAKLIIALGLAGGIMLTGCQKNESGSAEPTATPEPTEAAEEVTPEPTAMAAEEPEPTEDPIDVYKRQACNCSVSSQSDTFPKTYFKLP